MRLDVINNQWGQREKNIIKPTAAGPSLRLVSYPTPLEPLAVGVIILYTGDSVGCRHRRLSSLGV